MTSENMNKEALDLLYKQEWMKAQKLFFDNARRNPSLQTYNNLGSFLVSEGLICKNETVRNAYKLGLKYLFRAAEIEESAINLLAIANAFDYELRTSSKQRKSILYQKSEQYLHRALDIEYSDECYYNWLRVKVLIEPADLNVLNGVRDLIKSFVCRESVALYFQLLSMHAFVEEALQCIEKYGDFLDEIDLLLFYTKFELYEKGYRLCEEVCNQYDIDKYSASAIVECCVNTGHLEQAKIYSKRMMVSQDDAKYLRKVFSHLNSSTNYRRNIIFEYRSIPPHIMSCGYYGCTMHKTPWDNF